MSAAARRAPAIDVRSVSKTFRIPSVRRQTVREHALDFFRRRPVETLSVLDDVSLTVRRGESVALMGRNGSGKSTLLKIAAGIFPADRGTVTVAGPLTPILELGVGFNPELDAVDNIYLLGTVMGLSLSEVRGRLDGILAFAGLERFARLKLQHFSSGMIARLAYSVAFSAVSEILLLDEIFAVGDAAFKTRCEERYKALIAAGHTVLLVSHDPCTVAELCERAILLEGGRIVLDGPSADVAAAYLKLLEGADALSLAFEAGRAASAVPEAPPAADAHAPASTPAADPVGERWAAAQAFEAGWWREWFATGGLDWPDDFRRRLEPRRPVQPRIAAHLPPSPRPTVLDVGSGPVSLVGTLLGDREIDLTSVDPLAAVYGELLASHGHDPALGPLPGDGERLAERLPLDHFDVVTIENALGHTREPLRVIEQMLAVARVGGRVLILDEENEAEAHGYLGLDQWNLAVEDGRFIVWNPGARFDVTQCLAGRADVRAAVVQDPAYRRAVSVEITRLASAGRGTAAAAFRRSAATMAAAG